jgi:hypothetical protein
MNQHNEAPLHLIFVCLALVLFGLAAFAGPWSQAPQEPWYRGKLIAGGLFFWTLSTFFG